MASATYSPSNSSVYEWLNFDWDTVPELFNCQENDANVSCARVCNDSDALFSYQSANLVNCGIWTSLVMAYTSASTNGTLGPSDTTTNNDASSLFTPFQVLDLNATRYQNTSIYADVISNCLEFMYINVKRYSFADNGHAPAACTRHDLFPLDNYSENSLGDCLKEICAPLTLNPDLAGIGVFSSFIAQSGIALIALVALLSFDLWNPIARRSDKAPYDSHKNRVMIALVEFHKAQCYFSSIIQITALSLFHASKTAAKEYSNVTVKAGTYENFFDTSVLVVLASSGLIPISLVLACITRYARQSWYLLIISWITIILASTTFVTSFYWSNRDAKDSDWYSNNLNYDFRSDNDYGGESSCVVSGTLGDSVIPLCGNSKLLDNAVPPDLLSNWGTWLIWINCLVWMVVCLGKKCYDTKRLFGFRNRGRDLASKITLARWIAEEGRAHRAWILVSIIPWSLCFAAQFYLFSSFFDHRVISYSWSFGQIIAVFVWVPSIVEFIYIEFNGIQRASNYRYPSPLIVMKHVAHSSFSLAQLTSPEIRRDDEYAWSPDMSKDNVPAAAPRGHYSLIDGNRY